jgi:hypothetical protein
MTGTADRTLVADHDDVALGDLPTLHRRERVLLALEHARRALCLSLPVAAIFRTAPSGARFPRE